LFACGNRQQPASQGHTKQRSFDVIKAGGAIGLTVAQRSTAMKSQEIEKI
jgi:hypothetical protein